MRNLLGLVLAFTSATFAACTTSPPAMSMGGGGGGGGGGTPAAGTVLTGTLQFSPITDSLDKFDVASLVDDNHQAAPPLAVLHESAIGTGNCSMIVLPSGEQFGASGWVFAAPAGQTFTHVSVTAPVTLDPRADTSTTSVQALLLTQSTSVPLTSLGESASGPASQADIDAAVAGLDQFAIAFGIDNPDYSDDLERIFPQALRQCPGDAAPFTISAEVE